MAKENKGVATEKGQPADRTNGKRKTMVVRPGGVTVVGADKDKNKKVKKHAS